MKNTQNLEKHIWSEGDQPVQYVIRKRFSSPFERYQDWPNRRMHHWRNSTFSVFLPLHTLLEILDLPKRIHTGSFAPVTYYFLSDPQQIIYRRDPPVEWNTVK
ncbi:MAG: hypothetical protein GY820_06575 [Gammaproteobacteria bacterium]|nr:hypothetical protein [Gammaproteobacteria bacterium]